MKERTPLEERRKELYHLAESFRCPGYEKGLGEEARFDRGTG